MQGRARAARQVGSDGAERAKRLMSGRAMHRVRNDHARAIGAEQRVICHMQQLTIHLPRQISVGALP